MVCGLPLYPKVAVVKVATALAFSATVPSVLLPSRKVTLPVGVPPESLTTAVKVTLWPNADGLFEEISAVVTSCEVTMRIVLTL